MKQLKDMFLPEHLEKIFKYDTTYRRKYDRIMKDDWYGIVFHFRYKMPFDWTRSCR